MGTGASSEQPTRTESPILIARRLVSLLGSHLIGPKGINTKRDVSAT